jgi:hypothetical protein
MRIALPSKTKIQNIGSSTETTYVYICKYKWISKMYTNHITLVCIIHDLLGKHELGLKLEAQPHAHTYNAAPQTQRYGC